MKVMAIDFGERRVGLAISDPAGLIALPLKTIARESDRQLIRELAALAAAEGVELIVIGEPRRLDGSRGQSAERVGSFARKLEGVTHLPYRLIDESLTSRQAEQRLRTAGLNPLKDPDKVDAVAAQILLAEVLDQSHESDE
ncbi:MAG: Holliday junction resolvase RuvX [Acidobacteriota bacterium]|nr:Holliday junction resolvase RuvX [Acidobacteriota bacterium]